MKLITFFFMLLFVIGCSKNKTVLICGDHICINKAEAKQYFEENLSLEVKIINQNIKKQVDLVELNLRNNDKIKKISITKKEVTNKDLKILSNTEKEDIKNKIKFKNKEKKDQKNKKIVKKINKKKTEKNYFKQTKLTNNKRKAQKVVNKSKNEIEDICSLIKVCNIDEISKYLLEIGKKKDYPDITKRQ